MYHSCENILLKMASHLVGNASLHNLLYIIKLYICILLCHAHIGVIFNTLWLHANQGLTSICIYRGMQGALSSK